MFFATCEFKLLLPIYCVFAYLCAFILGLIGFDSKMKWWVSTSGAVKPARKSRTQNYNWRKFLRSCRLIEA